MKRLVSLFALLLFAVASLCSCGPSEAEQERQAAHEERVKLQEEKHEEKMEKVRTEKEEAEHQAQVTRECRDDYDRCVLNCNNLAYVTTREACVDDCIRVRDKCLSIK